MKKKLEKSIANLTVGDVVPIRSRGGKLELKPKTESPESSKKDLTTRYLELIKAGWEFEFFTPSGNAYFSKRSKMGSK